ncbi:LuxR family transcriptional regulator [Paractinoplanes hotanensis]|uniref:LuxR C-terminal-related transcriptional regulator n=1 Tax=Paractinoplanes hotanensis TaxID=2906497 RepID=A0ABT0Y8A7_9ACTN|nr:LuxR family transcriptional regulator [Actinoplanes hotanensis]MCM4082283.1 LuxR C-terminal-related transcriptional regulator [Actinoplanes hotanensis]
MDPVATVTESPILLSGLRYARAVLADADAAFESALSAADVSPVEVAHLRLAHGVSLRLRRRPVDSRIPLAEAHRAFTDLGLLPSAARAADHLNATGAAFEPAPSAALDALTTQELQVTRMAAAGLTNRDIAQRLHLSPRTVETHLYRVYTKLRVTNRRQLRRFVS